MALDILSRISAILPPLSSWLKEFASVLIASEHFATALTRSSRPETSFVTASFVAASSFTVTEARSRSMPSVIFARPFSIRPRAPSILAIASAKQSMAVASSSPAVSISDQFTLTFSRITIAASYIAFSASADLPREALSFSASSSAESIQALSPTASITPPVASLRFLIPERASERPSMIISIAASAFA